MHRNTTSMNPMGLLRHRELIAQLTRREVSQRYKGSLLGMAWPLVQPLLMLTVYTFVFSVVFRARWPSLPGADTADREQLVTKLLDRVSCSLIVAR